MRIQRLDADTRQNLLEDLLKRSPNNYGEYEKGVAEILARVKREKDEAVFDYTRKFDQAVISACLLYTSTEKKGRKVNLMCISMWESILMKRVGKSA